MESTEAPPLVRAAMPAPSSRTAAAPAPRVAVLLNARQQASDRTRTDARQANEKRRSREAAIRAAVRKEMARESTVVRERAEREQETGAQSQRSATPLSEQVSRAGTALSLLAAYRREEGLDDEDDSAATPPPDPGWADPPAETAAVPLRTDPAAARTASAPPDSRSVADHAAPDNLREDEVAKLELLQALSKAKRDTDAELKELAARRAARAAAAQRSGASGLPKSSLFHWSVGSELAASKSEPAKRQSSAADAAWEWANRAAPTQPVGGAQPGP